MEKPTPSRFFKAFVSDRPYKVFLDDVAFICKVALRRTPRLQPYEEMRKQAADDTDESAGPESGMVEE